MIGREVVEWGEGEDECGKLWVWSLIYESIILSWKCSFIGKGVWVTCLCGDDALDIK